MSNHEETSPAIEPLTKLEPDIRLFGEMNDVMLQSFLTQCQKAMEVPGQVLLELCTLGGDADIGRRIAVEIRLCRERRGKDMVFLGKTTVYSAGVTVMSAFPVAKRYLTRDTLLLIHERRLNKQLDLSGAMRACVAQVKDTLEEIEAAQALEREGFEALVMDSRLPLDELMQRVMTKNWYLGASRALSLGLIAAVI